MENAALCRPVPVYFIEEAVFPSPLGFGAGRGTSVSHVTIGRKVAQMCIQQNFVVDGTPRNGAPTTFEYIKHYLGLSSIGGRDKPGTPALPVLVYAGWQHMVEVGFTFGRAKLKGPTRFDVPTPKLFFYGRDPIPHVKLYSAPNIYFYALGGQGAPTALAIYDPGSKEIQQVPPDEQKRLVEMLNAKVANYRWR
jgi:hypothetical protein